MHQKQWLQDRDHMEAFLTTTTTTTTTTTRSTKDKDGSSISGDGSSLQNTRLISVSCSPGEETSGERLDVKAVAPSTSPAGGDGGVVLGQVAEADGKLVRDGPHEQRSSGPVGGGASGVLHGAVSSSPIGPLPEVFWPMREHRGSLFIHVLFAHEFGKPCAVLLSRDPSPNTPGTLKLYCGFVGVFYSMERSVPTLTTTLTTLSRREVRGRVLVVVVEVEVVRVVVCRLS
ncbi:hypothetical protein O3P69_001193 [Scylla paramamosain]|uniref:Uncharacterized protein n=1 Tax=Scylla paramamosain TaxID=85552 RepID=A0AAW0USC3_SCYPA